MTKLNTQNSGGSLVASQVAMGFDRTESKIMTKLLSTNDWIPMSILARLVGSEKARRIVKKFVKMLMAETKMDGRKQFARATDSYRRQVVLFSNKAYRDFVYSVS